MYINNEYKFCHVRHFKKIWRGGEGKYPCPVAEKKTTIKKRGGAINKRNNMYFGEGEWPVKSLYKSHTELNTPVQTQRHIYIPPRSSSDGLMT